MKNSTFLNDLRNKEYFVRPSILQYLELSLFNKEGVRLDAEFAGFAVPLHPTEMGGTGLAHGASSRGRGLCEWVLLNCSFISLPSVSPNAESSPHH